MANSPMDVRRRECYSRRSTAATVQRVISWVRRLAALQALGRYDVGVRAWKSRNATFLLDSRATALGLVAATRPARRSKTPGGKRQSCRAERHDDVPSGIVAREVRDEGAHQQPE